MSAQKEASSLPSPEGTEQSEVEPGLDITSLSVISHLLRVGLIFKNTKTSNKTELLALPRQVSYHILQLPFSGVSFLNTHSREGRKNTYFTDKHKPFSTFINYIFVSAQEAKMHGHSRPPPQQNSCV